MGDESVAAWPQEDPLWLSFLEQISQCVETPPQIQNQNQVVIYT